MRSCIYCGKELAKGESCDCAAAVRARGERASSNAQTQNTNQNTTSDNSQNNKRNTEYTGWQENTYRTGYTKKPKKSIKNFFKKFKFQKKSGSFREAASGVHGFTRNFMGDPVNTVSNPAYLSMWQILIIAVLTSLALSLCGFFAYTRVISHMTHAQSLFESMFSSLYVPKYTMTMLLETALTGTVTGTILIFLFFGILYFANKFVLRQNVSFTTFCVRPAAALIPLMVFTIIGVLINFFSVYAMIMLFLTGVVMWIVLTYEGLRSEWSFAPATKVMYVMAASYFVFYVIVFNLMRVI